MKTTIIFIVVGVAILGGVFMLGRGNQVNTAAQNNTSTIDGKQVVEITAKGGYSPSSSAAKADTPTVLKVTTRGTFDCSAALTIPSIGYRTTLPASGVTMIDIPAQKSGTVLKGLCSMGMYYFDIRFN